MKMDVTLRIIRRDLGVLRPLYMTIASIALSVCEGLDVDRWRKSEDREKKVKDFCNLRDESHEMMVACLL